MWMSSGWRIRPSAQFYASEAVGGDGLDADAIVNFTQIDERAFGAGLPYGGVWRLTPEFSTTLTLPGIAGFSLRDGRVVDVAKASGADLQTIELMITGPVLAALIGQRGLLALDGAAVGWRDGALLIVGASGLGKSTITAALVKRGYPVLNDGVLAVDVSVTRPMLMRTSSKLRLWQRAMRTLDVPINGLSPVRPGAPRFDTVWCEPPPGPIPVSGVVILGNRASEPHGKRLPAAAAVAHLVQAHCGMPLRCHDKASAARIMAALLVLASEVDCWTFAAADGLAALPETVDGLQGLLGS